MKKGEGESPFDNEKTKKILSNKYIKKENYKMLLKEIKQDLNK